jgi:hypothetical protein
VPIPDIYSLAYGGVRSILENRASWAALIKPPSRIWLNTKAKPWKDALGDSDFPASILLQGDGSDSVAEQSKTFGTFANPQCAARIEEFTREYQLAIIHPALVLASNNNLILETLAALRGGMAAISAIIAAAMPGGVTGKVKIFGPITFRHDDTGRGPAVLPIPITGNTIRAVSFFRIPMTMVFNTNNAPALLS